MVINWLIGGLEHEWMNFPWGKITPTDEVHHFSEGLVETTNHHQPVIESQHWEEIMGKYGQKKTEQIWKDDVLQAMGTSSFFSKFHINSLFQVQSPCFMDPPVGRCVRNNRGGNITYTVALQLMGLQSRGSRSPAPIPVPLPWWQDTLAINRHYRRLTRMIFTTLVMERPEAKHKRRGLEKWGCDKGEKWWL